MSVLEVKNPQAVESTGQSVTSLFARPVESVTFVFLGEFAREKNVRPVEGVPELASLLAEGANILSSISVRRITYG
jgi:hypothetical protein